MLKKINRQHVLISASGSGTAFAMIMSLRKTWGEAISITTMDINPRHLVTSSLLANDHIICPRSDNQIYGSFVIETIKKHNVSLFCPILNNDFILIDAIIRETGCKVMAPQCSTELACSKTNTACWLRNLGLPTPPILSRRNIISDQMYFAKPDNGFGSIRSRIITGSEALTSLDDSFIVQPLCDPPEITVDAFFDVETGRCRAIARERIEIKSGVCTKAWVYEDEILSEYAFIIGNALKQRGTICFQVMRLDEKPVITDLNFRPGAGTAITVAAGIDMLSASFACQWGLDYHRFISNILPKEGLFVTRQYSEFVMR